MPLLVNSVPNLAQGVSQQPDNLRFPGQCDEQINAWATVVEGLVKRPNTRHVNKLFTHPVNDDAFVQYIDRDDDNRFACVLENKVSLCAVSLFNLNTGSPVTQVSISTRAQTYLNNISNLREDVKALTVADYTFIANKEQTVSISSSQLSEPLEREALLFVKLGDYKKNYNVYIDDLLVPFNNAALPSAHTNEHTPHDDYPATYRSGGGAASDGFDADTGHIAKDLSDLIAYNYTQATNVISSITVTNGGGNYTADLNALSSNILVDSFRVTAVVEQYDSNGVLKGQGAKGVCDVQGGVIQSVTMLYGGTGYDSSYPDPIIQFIPEVKSPTTEWSFEVWGGLNFFYPQFFPTPTPLATGTTTLSASGAIRTENKDAIIKISRVSYVSHNNKFYKCIQNHTASSTDEPGVGANYSTYWIETTRTDLASPWASTTSYIIGSDFSIRAADGLADQGLGVIYKEVSSITDLPAKCYNNFRVKVIGDPELDQDDYYVRFKAKDNKEFGEGTWIETIGWKNEDDTEGASEGIKSLLNPNTLPLQLKPTDTSFNYWTLDVASWEPRKVGDDRSNPAPSLVGSKVKDMFFFKNRLGFLTKNNVLFSEADEYFNFWRTSVLSLLDSAPIDVGISHTKVVELQHAVPFQEKLVIFSNRTQFVLRGSELLTPKTVSITPTTEYDSSETITPLVINNYLYFNFKRNNSEGLMEYYVDADNNIFDASEITSQIPTYIPSTLELMVGSSVQDLIVALNGDRTTMFVYKFFWQNKEKVQSAWQKFTFSREIISAHFIEANLFVITKDSESTYLEKLPMENNLKDGNDSYTLLLDSRLDKSELSFSYSASTKLTTISGFPYDPNGVEIYSKTGHKYPFTRTSTTEGTVIADLTSVDFVAGFPYDMLYKFSDQSLKQPTERGGRSSTDYAYQTIRSGSLNYAETGHFTVEITPKFRDTYSYAFNPEVLGSNLTLNTFVPQDGHFRFPVQAQPNDATIQIKSSSALPVKILAAEFESMMIPRSRRYGS